MYCIFPYCVYQEHRRSWVIFRGGPSIPSCQNSSLSCQNFSCQGGPSLPILFCHAKLLCQTVLPMGKHCRWMAAKQSKMEEKQENMVETNQKWQKTDKNDRKPWKMWSFTNYLLPSSHFCPAKLPLLSCQAAISVLPSSHFCPAKLTNFSKGGPTPMCFADNNCCWIAKWL